MKRMKLNIQLFANGEIEFPISRTLQGKIVWSSTSNGSVANSSNVTAKLYARMTSSYAMGPDWTAKININGSDSTKTSWDGKSLVVGTTWKEVHSYTLNNISHNSDGTKTIEISGSIKGPSGTTVANKISQGSSNVKLDTILRAVDCPRIEGEIPIEFIADLRPYSDFTFKFYFADSNNTRHLIGEGTGNITISLGTSYYQYVPSNTNLVEYPLYLQTYTKNGTLIGETQNKLILKINPSINKPTISNIVFSDQNSITYSLTGDRSKLISGYSSVTITADTTYKNGALPNDILIYQAPKVDNKLVFLGQYSNSSNEIEIIDFVPTYDINRIYYIIPIDSRLNYPEPSTSNSYIPNILNYEPVKLLPSVDFEKGYEISRPSPYSDQMYIKFIGSYWNSDFGSTSNSLTIQWKVKEQTGVWSDWINLSKYNISTSNNVTTFASSSDGYSTGITITNPLSSDGKWDYLENYNFELKFTDKLSEVPISTNVESTVPIYEWWQDSNKENYFNVNGELLINNANILDLIFPIGRGFIDFTDTNYSNYLGFTWERELVGLTPIGYNPNDSDFNAIGKTLGSKTHYHPQNLFYILHNNNYYLSISNLHRRQHTPTSSQFYGSAIDVANVSQQPGYESHKVQYMTDDGSSIQPSKIVAYWKRIA